MNDAQQDPLDQSSRVPRPIKVLVLAATVLLTMEAALVLLVQLYLKDLGASPMVISLSGSLAWAGTLLASPVWGAFSDRYPTRRLLTLVFIGSALATAPLAGLLAAPVVLAIGTVRRFLANGLPPIGMQLISATSGSGNRGRNLSLLSAARAAGFVFGGMVAGFLLERLGFRITFLLVAGLPFLVLPAFSTLPRRSQEQDGAMTRMPQRPLRVVWKLPLLSLYGAVALRQLATTGVGALAFVYMSSKGLSTEVMGLVSAVNPAIAVLSTLAFGRVVDRRHRKPIIILFGFAVVILYPLLYVFARSPITFIIAAVPLGLSFGAYYSGATAHIGRVIPMAHHGRMFGLLDSCRGLGGLLGPILAGAVVTAWGYRPMFLVMVAICVLALLLAVVGARSDGLHAH
jgi:MFS family permease